MNNDVAGFNKKHKCQTRKVCGLGKAAKDKINIVQR